MIVGYEVASPQAQFKPILEGHSPKQVSEAAALR
jgi:hypothetical protein